MSNLEKMLRQLDTQKPLTVFDIAAMELESECSLQDCLHLEAAYLRIAAERDGGAA